MDFCEGGKGKKNMNTRSGKREKGVSIRRGREKGNEQEVIKGRIGDRYEGGSE